MLAFPRHALFLAHFGHLGIHRDGQHPGFFKVVTSHRTGGPLSERVFMRLETCAGNEEGKRERQIHGCCFSLVSFLPVPHFHLFSFLPVLFPGSLPVELSSLVASFRAMAGEDTKGVGLG
jgi:hypothetical protein